KRIHGWTHDRRINEERAREQEMGYESGEEEDEEEVEIIEDETQTQSQTQEDGDGDESEPDAGGNGNGGQGSANNEDHAPGYASDNNNDQYEERHSPAPEEGWPDGNGFPEPNDNPQGPIQDGEAL